MGRVTSATIALTFDQREQVARDYLIQLLEDFECVPFGDTKLVNSLNTIIAYMSPLGEWAEGQYDGTEDK